MIKMKAKEPDPFSIGIGVFSNERELWDTDEMPRDQHLMLCAEAAIRIAVIAERKRCVDTINDIWDSYVNSDGHDSTGKPYLRGYKDGLEDCAEALMLIDTQEGVDAESAIAAIRDEQRERQEALASKKERQRIKNEYQPESPEPDAWEMMRSGNAERAKLTEEDHAPSAIEGAEQIEHIVQSECNDDFDLEQFGDAEY